MAQNTRPSFNLASPNQIQSVCELANLEQWFVAESQAIENLAIRKTVCDLARNLNDFVRFPKRAILLWPGCDRVAPEGKKQKYHQYPTLLKDAARKLGVNLDTRPNGPAIASFLFAEGQRPERFGSTNAWSIHHLYSGKFPYIGKTDSLHGQKDGKHFTQSAGLVAVHPLADALCDEFPAFSWFLRAQAFLKFGYDPDCIFARSVIDGYGFVQGSPMEIYLRQSA